MLDKMNVAKLGYLWSEDDNIGAQRFTAQAMQQRAFLITFCVSRWMPMFMQKIQSSHIICSYNSKLENTVTLRGDSRENEPIRHQKVSF